MAIKKKLTEAFSLVELSIVLVILGLLVGGILAGQSLIRAAELRAVSSEISRYQTAFSAFRDKYFGLPGDITNAYSFWGVAIGCTNNTGPTTAGCNGNGNGQIAHNTSEMYRVWEHLAYAGLIEGRYSGVYSGQTAAHGVDVPASKLGNGGWGVAWVNPNVYIVWLNTTPANWLILGSSRSANLPIGAILKPEEAWNIDTKMDDGLPVTGTIIGGTTLGSANCTSGTTYLLSNSATVCGIGYKMN